MFSDGQLDQNMAFFSCDTAEGVTLFGTEHERAEQLKGKVLDLYKMGRHAAHLGLKALGADEIEVGRGERGQPLWPQGFVGSIAHTEGRALALVGSKEHFVGLGIDVEKESRVLRRPWLEK